MTDRTTADNASVGTSLEVAVLIPCHNERGAVGRVVAEFRRHLPDATIYVYDNNSTDGTAAEALAAGAVVRHEPRQGKGAVVRRMFADIDADIYLMVDGDATYDAASAPRLVAGVVETGADMVVGVRRPDDSVANAFRPGHAFGNRMLTGIVRWFFGRGFTDMLSGYRAFSRRFVKSFPMRSGAFEIETELTIHALSLGLPAREVDTPFFERCDGTQSKLRTYTDGIRIMMMILRLMRDFKPLMFFGAIAGGFAALAVVLAIPLFVEYFETGLVPRFPTAVLVTGLAVSGLLMGVCGLILHNVAQLAIEAKQLAYLAAGRSPLAPRAAAPRLVGPAVEGRSATQEPVAPGLPSADPAGSG